MRHLPEGGVGRGWVLKIIYMYIDMYFIKKKEGCPFFVHGCTGFHYRELLRLSSNIFEIDLQQKVVSRFG